MRCQLIRRIPEMRENLLRLYYTQATATDQQIGADWYPCARAIVDEWSAHYRLSRETVACVIAALSPQCEWERNLIIAQDIIADIPISIDGALHANIRKARTLREYGDRETVASRMSVIFPTGPKVNAFARNLAGDNEAVTVDAHAYQAAVADPTDTKSLHVNRYNVVADCYRQAAFAVARPPAEFQAIVWHTWKRLYPSERKNQIRRERA